MLAVRCLAALIAAAALTGASAGDLRETPHASDYVALVYSPDDAASADRASVPLTLEAAPRPGLPSRLAFHPLKAKTESQALSSGSSIAKGAPAHSVDGVYQAIGPRWVQADPARAKEAAAAPAYRFVVLSSPAAGRDADYNDWYDHQHVQDVMRVPGFQSAQRYRLVRQTGGEGFVLPGYAMVFELRSSDIPATQQDIRRRIVTGVTKMTTAFDNDTAVSRYYRLAPTAP